MDYFATVISDLPRSFTQGHIDNIFGEDRFSSFKSLLRGV